MNDILKEQMEKAMATMRDICHETDDCESCPFHMGYREEDMILNCFFIGGIRAAPNCWDAETLKHYDPNFYDDLSYDDDLNLYANTNDKEECNLFKCSRCGIRLKPNEVYLNSRNNFIYSVVCPDCYNKIRNTRRE